MHLFLVFFPKKNTYCCRTRRLYVRLSVRPSVCISVRLSVSMSFLGNLITNEPIDPKISLNVG